MKKKAKVYQHEVVLPSKRPLRCNIAKSPVTGSLGVVGELDEPSDSMKFDGIINALRRGDKRTEDGYGGHLLRYIGTDNSQAYKLGESSIGIEIRAAVIALHKKFKRRRKHKA